MKKISLILLMLCLFVSSSFSTEYYVSPTGTETWPNCTTSGNPCKASNTDKDFLGAVAGDTVWFLDGLYPGLVWNEASYRVPAWNPENSGTSGNPITFKAVNDKAAILQGIQTYYSGDITCYITTPIIGAYGKSYITWDGFTVQAVDNLDDPAMVSVYVYGGDIALQEYNTIKNCEITGVSHDTLGSCNYEAIRVENNNYFTAENNVIHGYNEDSENHNTSGVKLYETTYASIKNNEFYDNTLCVYSKGRGNQNVTVENNYMHDANSGIIYALLTGQEPDFHIINNLITNMVTFGVQDDNNVYLANDLVIKNNTFFNAGTTTSPTIVSSYADVGHYSDITNNLFYADDTGPVMWTRAGTLLNSCDYNLYFGRTNWVASIYSSSRSYNSFSAWQASTEIEGGGNPDVNGLNGEPVFVGGATPSTIAGFELASASPGENAGSDGKDMGADVSLVGPDAGSTNPVVTCQSSDTTTETSYAITATYTLEGARTVSTCTWSNSLGGSGSLTATGGNISGTITGLSIGANVITITLTDSEAEEGNCNATITRTSATDGQPMTLGGEALNLTAGEIATVY